MRSIRAAVIIVAIAGNAPAASAQEPPEHLDKIDLWAGLGAGEYAFHLEPLDPKQVVPFTEIGAEARWQFRPDLVLGLQASAREDGVAGELEIRPLSAGAVVGGIGIGGTPGGMTGGGDGSGPDPRPELVPGSRWRLAPYVEHRWRDLRLRGGVVAGTYYAVTDAGGPSVWLFPMASAAVGNDFYEVEIGLLDAPATAASATGGLGVLSLRIGFVPRPGHRLILGAGAPYAGPGADQGSLGGSPDLGHFSYAYQAEFQGGVRFRLGGYTATDTTGLYAMFGLTL